MMPPFIPAKRDILDPPSTDKRPSLFDAADKSTLPKKSLQDNKLFVEGLENGNGDSSLSDVSSGEFEDALVPSPKRRKVDKKEEEDADVDWEDAMEQPTETASKVPVRVSGDLELTLDKDDVTSRSLMSHQDRKKGPSKIEREIRISTHRMHVQFLLFHNMMRSRWACDTETQKILMDQLPEQVRVEVDKWRIDSGLSPGQLMSTPKRSKIDGRKRKRRAQNERSQRDWGKPAERQEKGEPNMSAGDPIIRLMKLLCAYWKKKFVITAPGLRKQGYKSLQVLEEEIISFRKNSHDAEAYGERIDGIEGFRKAARSCGGSRDVGAQLFTALLRGLGIETRLVASLQPIGFGWSKNEDATVKKEKKHDLSKELDDSELSSFSSDSDDYKPIIAKNTPTSPSKRERSTGYSKGRPGSSKNAPIDLLEDAEASFIEQNDDEQSVVDVTPEIPRKRQNTYYDRDLPVPNYWTEIISPITYQVYPVDSLVSKIPIITSSEYLAHFEPRGAAADKAKQVFAYVIAHSSDGTAKDVTTRYLKRHVWPGRTKGVRLPPEKVPIYNRKGKIKKHEKYDWFKTVMSGYERPHLMRTAVDDLEEEKDLKPAKFEKKDANVREDTLQFYKTSAEFVLERHLRREEAIKPGSKPVRNFVSGKGDDAKEEPVYRRQDVEVCRTGESWHKEGRAVKPGEQPMKMVPIRAVTLTRKREVEEAERDSGEKQKQGLYAWNQTDWIIPPPIENGRIPKNTYGNIDCFVPTMVPKGAVHIPLRKTVMICKKLGIDYAEAVTGFEFGNKMAVPVIEGVVVAETHANLVIDRWEKEERERKIKEEGKREKMALGTWRKWLMGLRIIQRVKEEYGGDADAHMKEEMNPFTNQNKARKSQHEKSVPQAAQEARIDMQDDGEAGGGFILDDDDDNQVSGFLPTSNNKEAVPDSRGEGMIEGVKQTATAPRRGLAVLAADSKSSQHQDATPQFLQTSKMEEEEEEETSKTPNPQSKPNPTSKGKLSERTLPEINSPHRKPSEKANKRGKVKISRPSSSPSSPIRSVPRRNAARNSAKAMKSHYFNHDRHEDEGEDEMGSSEHDDHEGERIEDSSTSEQPMPKKQKRAATRSRRKGL